MVIYVKGKNNKNDRKKKQQKNEKIKIRERRLREKKYITKHNQKVYYSVNYWGKLFMYLHESIY